MFRSRRSIKQHGFMAGNGREEIHYGAIFPPRQKRVIPGFDHVLLGDGLDLGKIHDHALIGGAGSGDDRAAERDLDGVAVAVQMPALAAVIGDAVAGVEFQPSGDAHGGRIITSGTSHGRIKANRATR